MARIIVVIIFGGFGIVMLAVGTRQFWLQRRLLGAAQQVEALITHSAVVTSTTRDTDPSVTRNTSTTSHRPDVRFRYTVQRQEYESDLLYPTIIVRAYASHDAAAAALAPFPVGARVRAFVDPTLPGQAFLIAAKSAAPVVFIVIGILLPPLAWFAGAYV